MVSVIVNLGIELSNKVNIFKTNNGHRNRDDAIQDIIIKYFEQNNL